MSRFFFIGFIRFLSGKFVLLTLVHIIFIITLEVDLSFLSKMDLNDLGSYASILSVALLIPTLIVTVMIKRSYSKRIRLHELYRRLQDFLGKINQILRDKPFDSSCQNDLKMTFGALKGHLGDLYPLVKKDIKKIISNIKSYINDFNSTLDKDIVYNIASDMRELKEKLEGRLQDIYWGRK